MRIHCICLVRDEADILGHTLTAALEWADAIYVLDNGSIDGTWELVHEFAARFPQIVVAGRTTERYRNSMVGDVANMFLHRAAKTDWWCRLDADENYPENPRQFLSGIGRRYQLVYNIYANYFFTELDLEEYERDPIRYRENWSPEKLRYYLTNWSDVRFLRHIPGADWSGWWPRGIWEMRPAGDRILMRNYDYRSPPQIQRRLQIRLNETEEGSFTHEKKRLWAPPGLDLNAVVFPGNEHTEHDIWRTRVVRSDALYRDDGSGSLHVEWQLIPPMRKRLRLHLRLARRTRRAWREIISPLNKSQV